MMTSLQPSSIFVCIPKWVLFLDVEKNGQLCHNLLISLFSQNYIFLLLRVIFNPSCAAFLFYTMAECQPFIPSSSWLLQQPRASLKSWWPPSSVRGCIVGMEGLSLGGHSPFAPPALLNFDALPSSPIQKKTDWRCESHSILCFHFNL